jgi:formylglycine-generating enzyme required for sulfatase activity
LETPFVFDVMPVEDLTLYAKWEIQTYLVTFYDSDNITVLATSIVDHGEAAVAPADPLKEDTAEFTYTFDGWDKDVSDVRENMDVFPTYLESINYYTVTFWNYNGTVLTEEIVAYGHEAIAPEGPPKADTPQFTYTFDGWDTDVSDVRENMDVFPTYVSSTRNYTVTFLDADGTLLKEESVPYALAATPPSDPIKEHYTFTGWNQSFDRIVFDLTVYAQYTTNSYTVTFKDHDETILKTESVLYDTAATPPDNPARVGYTWVGWDTPIENIASDLVVHAIYEIASYQLIFEDIEGNILHAESFEYNEDIPEIIFPEAPDLTGHTFDGWEALPETMPPHHLIFTASYTHNVLNISMVRIGYREAIYTIPTRTSDSKTVDVAGGYYMATYETTYGLWYTVRMWAEDNGYSFQNPGREGDSGTDGMPPTENHKNKPVTYVSWRDAIVWTNALSEISHLDPVYRTDTGVIIRDARAANGAVVDAAIQTNHNGYRLPTSDEWEMAARWRNTDGDGSILVGGRYWTPGDYASGATDNYENEEATRAVAWYPGAEGGSFTRPVGQLMPNHLGLYDMCGNVWEWTYTAQSYTRIMRGGSYSYIAQMIRLGNTLAFNTTQASVMGFRLARG